MQLPRVVIAAVFFIIGALIAIPAIIDATSSPSRAAGASETTSPSPSPTATSPRPTGTRTATPTPSRSRTPPPTPPPTRTAPPAQPLSITVGKVQCPDRTVMVKVRNTGTRTEDYSIERNDDSAARPGRILPGQTESVPVKLREDRPTRIQVTLKNEPVTTRTRTADCKKSGAGTPGDTPPSRLPHTGADSSVLWARGATGAAAMITGAIIFWYGGIWPRRRDPLFGKKGG